MTRPGGRIGLVNWTPESHIGDLFKILGRYMPAPPEYASPPPLWGNEEHVREPVRGHRRRARVLRGYNPFRFASATPSSRSSRPTTARRSRRASGCPPRAGGPTAARRSSPWPSAAAMSEDGGVLLSSEYLVISAARRSGRASWSDGPCRRGCGGTPVGRAQAPAISADGRRVALSATLRILAAAARRGTVLAFPLQRGRAALDHVRARPVAPARQDPLPARRHDRPHHLRRRRPRAPERPARTQAAADRELPADAPRPRRGGQPLEGPCGGSSAS